MTAPSEGDKLARDSCTTSWAVWPKSASASAIRYSKQGLSGTVKNRTTSTGSRAREARRLVRCIESPPHLSPWQLRSFCSSHFRFKPFLEYHISLCALIWWNIHAIICNGTRLFYFSPRGHEEKTLNYGYSVRNRSLCLPDCYPRNMVACSRSVNTTNDVFILYPEFGVSVLINVT